MRAAPWAERGGAPTPWHPEHIAERYGLFTIIVLGETILSSSVAFQAVVDARTGDVTAALTAVGALLTVFSMWWIYFAKPAAPCLVSNRVAYPWGYGHYVVFASAAAVGAGVAVVVDQVTGHTHLAASAAAAAFTIPVILYLLAVTFIHTLLYGVRREHLTAMLVAIALVGVGDVHRPARPPHRDRAGRARRRAPGRCTNVRHIREAGVQCGLQARPTPWGHGRGDGPRGSGPRRR